jgi:glycine dehydrogenase subunit 2
VSLQPAAGSHGEFTGILMVRAYHEERGDKERNVILIPDSAHGTNPASTTMSGYTMVEIKSDERGNVDLEDLKAHCDERVAGLMLTNPNTLGLFDEHLLEVCQLVHDCGGLVYGDGANFNAIMGICKQVDLGFDVMHYNLHKTFSTPHGGGGPGAGPVGANEKLAPYLPGPIAVKDGPFDPSTLRPFGFAQGRLRSGQALLRTGYAQDALRTSDWKKPGRSGWPTFLWRSSSITRWTRQSSA